MSNEAGDPVTVTDSPGAILRRAREFQGMPEQEVAERLYLLPKYVGLLERDDYQALGRPAFARGYVRNYGKLLGVNETELMAAFDRLAATGGLAGSAASRKPPPLQKTGVGVALGLAVLMLLVLALWWWQGKGPLAAARPVVGHAGSAAPPVAPATGALAAVTGYSRGE